MDLKKWQALLYQQYLRDEKDKIFNPHGEVGDLAELAMVCCEEVGEAIVGIRKQKGIKSLKEECADIIIRTINFASRKAIDIESAIEAAHKKNVARNRRGLFISNKRKKHD